MTKPAQAAAEFLYLPATFNEVDISNSFVDACVAHVSTNNFENLNGNYVQKPCLEMIRLCLDYIVKYIKTDDVFDLLEADHYYNKACIPTAR